MKQNNTFLDCYFRLLLYKTFFFFTDILYVCMQDQRQRFFLKFTFNSNVCYLITELYLFSQQYATQSCSSDIKGPSIRSFTVDIPLASQFQIEQQIQCNTHPRPQGFLPFLFLSYQKGKKNWERGCVKTLDFTTLLVYIKFS